MCYAHVCMSLKVIDGDCLVKFSSVSGFVSVFLGPFVRFCSTKSSWLFQPRWNSPRRKLLQHGQRQWCWKGRWHAAGEPIGRALGWDWHFRSEGDAVALGWDGVGDGFWLFVLKVAVHSDIFKLIQVNYSDFIGQATSHNCECGDLPKNIEKQVYFGYFGWNYRNIPAWHITCMFLRGL